MSYFAETLKDLIKWLINHNNNFSLESARPSKSNILHLLLDSNHMKLDAHKFKHQVLKMSSEFSSDPIRCSFLFSFKLAVPFNSTRERNCKKSKEEESGCKSGRAKKNKWSVQFTFMLEA